MTDLSNSLRETEAECAAGRTAPRVSLDMIQANIAAEFFMRGHGINPAAPMHPSLEVLTICVLVLRNGFTVIGKSAPASAANFDAALGARLAKEDAIRQIWPLMGYELRERLHRQEQDEKFQRMDDEMQPAPGVNLRVPGDFNPKLGEAIGVQSSRNQASGSILGGTGMNDDGQWIRARALELANRADLDGSAVVERARTFFEFLRGPQPPSHAPAAFDTREGSVRYVGTKLIDAVPMTRLAYNQLRGWELPADENGDDEGYLVEYADEFRSNVDGFNGYVSWSPKDVFERTYQPL